MDNNEKYKLFRKFEDDNKIELEDLYGKVRISTMMQLAFSAGILCHEEKTSAHLHDILPFDKEEIDMIIKGIGE